jgi:hypothetical protein
MKKSFCNAYRRRVGAWDITTLGQAVALFSHPPRQLETIDNLLE